MNIDLGKVNKIHIIGIEGAGTSALARVLKEMGKEVVGSDEGDHFYYDVLKEAGIEVAHKFSPENLENFQARGLMRTGRGQARNRLENKSDLIIYSTAYDSKTNPELKAALESETPAISYSEALGLIFNQKFGIAVSGTHGKTTTAAMLALAMRDTGADPTAIIGSKIKQLNSGAVVGKSEYFVIEADEYQNKFKFYNPMAVVLTSVDYDHPDFFASEKDYRETFEEFIKRIPNHGFLVVCAEDADVLEIAKQAKCEVILYGEFADRIKENELKEEFKKAGKDVKTVKVPNDLKLQLPGQHNKLNATATLAVAQKLGLDEGKVKESLRNYEGTARRFEHVGKYKGAEIIDDYAHHPVEVKTTLKTAKQEYPGKKITCVFHPHTFTRTKALLNDFAQSFDDADRIIVLDIFGSAREKQGDVHANDLVEKMKVYMRNAEYISTIEEAFEDLKKNLGKGDVLITMGAGDVWKLAEKLVNSK